MTDDHEPVDGDVSSGAPDGTDGTVTTDTDRVHGPAVVVDGPEDPGAPRRREVRRVATLGASGSSPDGRVTTGVLAADATTRVELARRRRWLVGGGVLGIVTVLAYVLGSTLSADQAQQAARTQAQEDELAASAARAVVDRAEAYEVPAAAIAVDGRALAAALEEHLTTTERSTEALDEVVALTTSSLRANAADLDELSAAPPPPLADLVDQSAAIEVLAALGQLTVEAEALAVDTRVAADAAERWSAAIRAVDAALAAHAEVVAAKSADPAASSLADGWRSEVPPLEELERAAADAEQVPGLERWAAAHLAYARGTLDFVAEAVPLLEDGDTEAYDQLYDDTFDEDPFELREAATAGAEEALTDGPLLALATVSQRVVIVTDQVAAVETAVAGTLGSRR